MRGVSDGALMLSEDPRSARARRSAGSAALGGEAWRAFPWTGANVVEANPPAGFQARDPASPAYRFAQLDAAVASAVAAGLQPLLVVSHAPAFAEAHTAGPMPIRVAGRRARWRWKNSRRRSPSRYDGFFPDPLRPAPRCRACAVPGLERAQPRALPGAAMGGGGGRWSAFSPLLYRQLLNGFYAGVKSVQPSDMVVAAGVAPEGEPAGVGAMAPVTFLEGCSAWAHASAELPAEPPHFDVLAFHPLSVFDPDCRPSHRLTWRSPTSPRSPAAGASRAAAHGAARRRTSRCGSPSSTGKALRRAPTACPARCRPHGSRARCTGCGSPA